MARVAKMAATCGGNDYGGEESSFLPFNIS